MKEVLAQDPITNPVLGPTLQGKTGVGFFQSVLPAMVTLALVIGALIFFFMMVSGAIAWITSGGDKEAMGNAKGRLTNAIVGFILLLVVFVIIQAIETFFNINILSLDIGPLRVQ